MTALVTIAHIRELGYQERNDGKTFCADGIRKWCARHDIDYLELVYRGVPAERMRQTDGWGDKLAAMAEGNNDGRE